MVRQENFSLPHPPVANISGKKFLGALFNTQSAPRSRCPPQSFDASYAPVFNFVSAVRVQTMGVTGAQNFYNRQN